MVTLSIVPYTEIDKLSSIGRIKKLLNIAKEDKIVLLQGRLKAEEEAELIKTTMEEINNEFKGIELAVIRPGDTKLNTFDKFKQEIAELLIGDRQGLTVIGPATVVKGIKKDPKKIELLTKNTPTKKKSKKRK